MSSSHDEGSAPARPEISDQVVPDRRPHLWMAGALVILVGLVVLVVSRSGASSTAVRETGTPGQVLVLAIPAFLAGVLSFVSPCTLPLLPAYFAFTFQARRDRMVMMTIAFFLGLATSFVVLGATATAIGRLFLRALDVLTVVGGGAVIIFGLLSMVGRGFGSGGMRPVRTPTFLGSYLYGATFALGWTACVGPILAALLTLLAANGMAVLHGALLAFLYALGLGTPLILVAAFYQTFAASTWQGRILRGRGWTVTVGRWTLYLHSTNLVSGFLLMTMGVLLASGQLMTISRWGQQTALAQWILGIEDAIRSFFGVS